MKKKKEPAKHWSEADTELYFIHPGTGAMILESELTFHDLWIFFLCQQFPDQFCKLYPHKASVLLPYI